MLRTPWFSSILLQGKQPRCGTFSRPPACPTPLFSSSSFPSATTSPLNSWHSQDAIDNLWYFIRKHFNFLSFSAVRLGCPAFKMRKYEELTEKENWEIVHWDSFVEIYFTPRNISTAADNQISRRAKNVSSYGIYRKKVASLNSSFRYVDNKRFGTMDVTPTLPIFLQHGAISFFLFSLFF